MTSRHNTKPAPDKMTATYRKRAVYLALTLTVACFLVVINSYLTLEPGDTVLPIVNVLTVGAFMCLVATGMAYWGRVTTAVGLLISTLFLVIAFYLTQDTGNGTYLIIFVVVTSLGIVSQTLPVEKFRYINFLIIVATVALILLDLFYPHPRNLTILSASPGIIITAIVMAVVVGFVLRELPRYPLRIKMALTFLVITAIPLVLLASFNNYTARQILTQTATTNLLSGATQTVNQIDAFLDSELSSVRAEARLLGLGDVDIANDSTLLTFQDRSRISTFLRAYNSRESFLIQSYAFLDLNGIVFADTVLPNIGQDESDKNYFREALASPQPYVSPVQFLEDDNGRLAGYIHFSHVVYNRHGQAVGVLRARYHAAVLQNIINESGSLIGEDTYVALYDGYGFTLAHSQDEARRYKFLAWPNPNIFTEMRRNHLLPPGFAMVRHVEDNTELGRLLAEAAQTPVFQAVDTAFDSEPNLAAVAFSNNQPTWRIVTFQPEQTLLPPILVQTRSTTGLSLVLAIVSIIIALLVAQQITRPLSDLRHTSEQISAGDLEARVAVVSDDEFGDVGHAFNSMAEQLQQSLAFLETRVRERTHALEVSAQVSRSLSTILDPEELAKTVVEQVKTAFNYYHVHIYLLDDTDNELHMVGGTGRAGRMMLEQGHEIEYGKGLVGKAAATNSVVLIPNVTMAANWLPNPLLPDTQSEIAIPISLGDEVLGVLDVQHDVIDGLSDQDANLLQAVANQVAIALRNARQYQEAQDRAQQQQLLNEIGQKIQSTTNVEEALQTAVRELGQAVKAERTRARFLPTPSTNGKSE